jgi:hypothetical protein
MPQGFVGQVEGHSASRSCGLLAYLPLYFMIGLLHITRPYKRSNLTHFSDAYVILFNDVVSGEGYFGMNEGGDLYTLNRKILEKIWL